jgi:hypothetical protein
MTQATARTVAPGIGKPSLPRHRSLLLSMVQHHACQPGLSVHPAPPRHTLQYQVNACAVNDKAEVGLCTATNTYCDQQLDRRHGERSASLAYFMPELEPAKRSRHRLTLAITKPLFSPLAASRWFRIQQLFAKNDLCYPSIPRLIPSILEKILRIRQYIANMPIWQYKGHCVIYCQYGPQYLAIYCQNV